MSASLNFAGALRVLCDGLIRFDLILNLLVGFSLYKCLQMGLKHVGFEA